MISSIMKRRILHLSILAMTFATAFFFAFTSCSDKVDTSNMYSFTGKQVIDYLNEAPETSYFALLTKKVKLSSKTASTVADLLSARGNYTCFAPTNEAVQAYVDSITNIKGYPIENTPDSIARDIVDNSLIDNQNEDAYLSTTFQVGSFERPSFADRYMTVRFDTIQGGKLAIYINAKARIIKPDNKLENGVVHVVNRVITPSNETIGALIKNTSNLKVFSHLLEKTGWSDKMIAFRDASYEAYHPKEGPGCSTEADGAPQPCPDHRNTGYTVFAEPDSVFQAAWNLPEFKYLENGELSNWDEIMAVITQKCQELYPNATSNDLNSEDNAVNQFISYHLLPEALTYNQIVIHYNEIGFGYRNPTVMGIDAFDYYETMCKYRRLMKITEGSQTQGKRINRYVSKRDEGTYRELTVPRPGIKIMESNGGRDYNALNGYYYAIDGILAYDDDVPNKVLNERLRFDICSLLPEQMTNGFRRLYINQRYHIPDGYFDNMTFTAESKVNYLPGYACQWGDYQGDEYNIEGQYDVIVRLPPVPFYGTYQLRYGTQNVADRRSMCQFYYGSNKSNLTAIGLPLDMRVSATLPSIGYVADGLDADINDENDRVMYLHGYMKAPESCGPDNPSGVNTNFRTNANMMRRIVLTATMDPNKVYYLRMKSVLESTTRQLFIDYFELVPKNVYAGVYAEDKW